MEGREVKIHLYRRSDKWWNFVKTVLNLQIYRRQENCWVDERLLVSRGDLCSMELFTYSFKGHITAG
jgi:hypothetical protein